MHHGISNSVWPWVLPLSWILFWACHWNFFSSGSSPFLKFFQTGRIMGQSFDSGMATQSLTCCPVFLLEVGSTNSLSPLLAITSRVSPFEFSESLTSQVSGTFWRVPPTSYLLRLPVFILSAGLQGFSPFPSPNTRSGSLLPPLPLLFRSLHLHL